MEDEQLEQLNYLLQPAIQKAWRQARQVQRDSCSKNPGIAFTDYFEMELDNTRVDMSRILRNIDLDMHIGSHSGAERAAFELQYPSIPESIPDLSTDPYFRENSEGFEVWEGTHWVKLSRQANIEIKVFQDEFTGKPAVRVWANDPSTQTEVLYIDNDLTTVGWDLSMTRNGAFEDTLANPVGGYRYWEDPFYLTAKNGMAIGGLTSGLLEMRHFGNMTPWRTGEAIRDAMGWYRRSDGFYVNLSAQRGLGAGGHQVGARTALNRARTFQRVGRRLFWVGAFFSGYEIGNALKQDYSNKGEVITKASIDIAMGVIGTFGGPVGWLISGTYFVLDVSGAFGDWGQPSGISQDSYDQMIQEQARLQYGHAFRELYFELDEGHGRNQTKDRYLEERMIQQDNTRVMQPKILLKKGL